ncbi:MAG: trimethylamine methyltransferase family protein, partial [Armatimonadetes bacterium]|nr:trimethylamine methyltransferase family protein [Armatimonadota bacterium]
AAEVLSALHGLPEVGVFGNPVTMVDLPARMEPVESVALLMTHTDRPGGVEVLYADNIPYMIELGEIFSGKAGDHRFVASCNFVVPPLLMGARCAECIVEKTWFKIPGVAGTMPVSGATAPVTRAGTAAIEIAETIACWLCHRVLDPELPLGGILCSGSMDMATGRCHFGSPEAVVQDSMGIQTLKWFYDIDTCTSAAYVDPKQPGIQAAFDKVFKILAAGAFTGSFGGGAGLLDAGQVWSPVQFMLDWDVLDSVSALLRRVEVNEETLALDLIHDIARSDRRVFLDCDHTARHFRSSLWNPRFFDRNEWQGDVRERHRDTELLTKARDKWADAVRSAPGYELDADRVKSVRRLVRRARREVLSA